VDHLSMGASDMKRFVINILIFFGIVAVIDFAVGKVFHYLQANKAGGRTGAEYYACKESKEDIIIMGSSRASHHYVPQIITDSLGLSCFNAGQDGNGIILQYGRWKMISERYSPKLIIYDVNPIFDLCKNDNMTYVDRLKPFCNNNEVKDYVSTISPMEKCKLFSQMYCYNYKFIEMAFDCTKHRGDKRKGYLPLYGEIRREMVESDKTVKRHDMAIDDIKVKYLSQLASDCREKGTKLFFVASPCFRGGGLTIESFRAVSDISELYGIPFLYYYESDFSENADLFKDSQHLNDEGAMLFTKELLSRIQL